MKTKSRIVTTVALALAIGTSALAASPAEAAIRAPDGRVWELRVTCDPRSHTISPMLYGPNVNVPGVYMEVWSVTASGQPSNYLGTVGYTPGVSTRVSLRGAYLLKAVYGWVTPTLTLQTRAEWVPYYTRVGSFEPASYCYL